MSDILATYHPDTVVLPQQGVLSTDLSGFRLAFSWLTKQLWLSPRAYATALPELVGPLAAGRADHPLPVAHRHPLELATGTGTPPPFRSSIPGAMLATIPGLRTPDGAAAGAVLQTERLARPYATLESELFEIDFDELRFDFYGEGPATRAELVVNGVPLLTRSGGRRDARLQTVRFPVRAWRGTAASLRLVDGAARGYLAVDRVRSVRWADEHVLCDGESFPLWPGHPAGAVVDSSTLAASFGLGMVAGERTLTTLGRRGARRLQSATFRIDAPTLMLLFLDHSARGELALRVGTEIVRREKARDQRSWVALDWNVRRWMGQDATLELVDDDPVPEAGVGVDAIVLVAD